MKHRNLLESFKSAIGGLSHIWQAQRNIRIRLFYFVALFLYIAGIYYLSSNLRAEGLRGSLEDFVFNFLHMPVYGGLAFILLLAFCGKIENLTRSSKPYWITFVIILLLGIADEYRQSFLFGRTACAWDVFLNIVGVLSAFVMARVCLVKGG